MDITTAYIISIILLFASLATAVVLIICQKEIKKITKSIVTGCALVVGIISLANIIAGAALYKLAISHDVPTTDISVTEFMQNLKDNLEKDRENQN